MNTQVIAAIAGGLVIGGAAFIPMEVAANRAGAPAASNSQVQNQESDQPSDVTDNGSVDEASGANIDGTAGTAGTPLAPIQGPSFGSGDDDDDDDDHDDDEDEGDDDHEDDHEDDDEDEDDD
jgi:hypothetical protein